MFACNGQSSSTRTPAKIGFQGAKDRSPLSIIEQWQKDAKGAVEDAYANYVSGDDPGESARLVLVANPSDDLALFQQQQQLLRFQQHNSPHSAGRHPAPILLNDPSNKWSSNSTSHPSNTASFQNPNLLLVAHHSESVRMTKNDPHATVFSTCGICFVEINGRAYVHDLDPNSAAYQSGIRPKDSVQYAAVLAKEWEDPLGNDFDPISSQALERETTGQRITFHELKRVILQGSGVLGELDHLGEYGYQRSPSGNVVLGPRSSQPPPLPTTIRIGKKFQHPCGELLPGDDFDDTSTLQGSKEYAGKADLHNHPMPVVLVFRRTKQRPPKAWNVWPNYRLDDECDVACQILESLAISSASLHHPPSVDEDEDLSAILDDGSTTLSSRRSTSVNTSSTGVNKVLFSSTANGNYQAEFGGDLQQLSEDNVEASTLRGMISKAVGLAFVRTNKVVFGVSLHGGSGIVLARLSDGTWSSPSLIGMGGLGLGLQVGLEVASYIFVLQTEAALEHFSRGGSFTLGANVGAAIASMGREAVGAASVSSALCGIAQPIVAMKEDEYNFEQDEEELDFEIIEDDTKEGFQRRMRRRRRGDSACHPTNCQSTPSFSNGDCTTLAANAEAGGIAPIVAYAKSEGLYLGVSLEGSRIFARQEANARAYKYSSYNHKAVTARDILTGKIVSRPPEAEQLYALLHAIELVHDWSTLPVLPKSPWLGSTDHNEWASLIWDAHTMPYAPAIYTKTNGEVEREDGDSRLHTPRIEDLTESEDLEEFSTKFRELLFGGITVTRVGANGKREKRTLWLSSPILDTAISNSNEQRGSLKIGFVSKLYSATAQRKHLSASIINDKNVSSGASVASEIEGDELTLDSALLENQSLLTTTGTLQERVELSKKLSMDLVDVLTLTQSAPPNIRLTDPSERDRVICLDSVDSTKLVFVGNTVEESRLLYCGLKILLEKETARMGVRGGQATRSRNRGITSALRNKNGKTSPSIMSSKHQQYRKKTGTVSGYASSDIDDTDDGIYDPSEYYQPVSFSRDKLPFGWKSWGRLPGRSYMRAQSTSTDDGYPTYAHGQLLIRDVCKNVLLPLPLPLCRVLLLDSSSPVISKWEAERGDMDFERTPWTFPPATPREMEQFQSEHQLIASGSMCGAHRTISYERYRNGQPVRLSETHIVDSDDTDKLAFQVNERLPRRGFSIKVKILLRAVDSGNACEATVLGEIRPIGKNMSDPAAVHKALLKVLDELKFRYGTDCVGLLAGFIRVVENMPKDETNSPNRVGSNRRSTTGQWGSSWEEKKDSEMTTPKTMLGKTSVVKFEDVMNADVGIVDVPDQRFAQESRPGNKSASDYKARSKTTRSSPIDEDFTSNSSDPVTIEVKPLPKIRLSLMPSPREEDEENLDEEGEPKTKSKTKTKSKSKSSSKKSSSRSSSKRSSKRSSSRRS